MSQTLNAEQTNKAALARIHAQLARITKETRLQHCTIHLQNTIERKSAGGAVQKWAKLTIAEVDKLDEILGEIRAAALQIYDGAEPGSQSSGPITIGG